MTRAQRFCFSGLLLVALALGGPLLLAQKVDKAMEDSIVNTERQLWDAWKNKDSATFEKTLAPNAVTMGANGLEDRAATIKDIATHNCQVRDYSLTNTKVTQIDKDTVLLTYTANQDATCDGQKAPATLNVSTVFEKNGDKWMPAFHQESPAPESTTPTTKPR